MPRRSAAPGRGAVPTISAVGHETDVSHPTTGLPRPPRAAEAAVADRLEVGRQLDDLAARLAGGLSGRTRLAAERLGRTADPLHAAVADAVRRDRTRLERLAAQSTR